MQSIETFLKNNYSYVVATPQGKFVFPLGHKVQTIATLEDDDSIALIPPAIQSTGILSKYFSQVICSITFISVINHDLFDESTQFGPVSEFFNRIKVEKVSTSNKDIFDEIHTRTKTTLSTSYLVGLLQVKQIRDLVRNILEDKGELVGYLLSDKKYPKVYQIVSTNSNSSVFFTIDAEYPTRYFKKVGSLGSLTLTLQKDTLNKWNLSGANRETTIEEKKEFLDVILEQYKDVYL